MDPFVGGLIVWAVIIAVAVQLRNWRRKDSAEEAMKNFQATMNPDGEEVPSSSMSNMSMDYESLFGVAPRLFNFRDDDHIL